MKHALIDLTRPITFKDVFPNIVRGILSLILPIIFAFAIGASILEAVQYDRDAITENGVIDHVTSKTHRGRRGRVSTSYLAVIAGSERTVTAVVDSNIPAGSLVRYGYSPTLHSAMVIPDWVGRGNFIIYTIFHWKGLLLAAIAILMAGYSYYQLRFFYIYMSGRYTINGCPIQPSM